MNNNKDLIKNTVYENIEKFEFLIGHRALLLKLPETVNKYYRSTNQTTSNDVETLVETNPEDLKKSLMLKLNCYTKAKKLNIIFASEKLSKFSVIENRVTCIFECIYCDKKVLDCDTHNLAHNSSTPSPTSAQTIQRARKSVLVEVQKLLK